MNTIDKIKKILNDKIEQENEGIYIYEKILPVIQKHEGQKITKRILAPVVKALDTDERNVQYSTNHGMFHLHIYKNWKNSHQYDFSFLLAYDNDSFIRAGIEFAQGHDKANRGFVSFNMCYGSAAKERNKKREIILQDEELLKTMANAIDKRNEAARELEAFCDYDIPGWYTIQEIGTNKEKK